MIMFNLKKSVWNDYILMGTTIFPFVMLGFLIYFFVKNQTNTSIFYTFASIIPISIVLFILRISYIKSFLFDSETIQGIILDVGFYKDRGRIEYVFECDNKRYKSAQAIMKTKLTVGLNKGQVIKLLVKRDSKKALIRDLFFDFHENSNQDKKEY